MFVIAMALATVAADPPPKAPPVMEARVERLEKRILELEQMFQAEMKKQSAARTEPVPVQARKVKIKYQAVPQSRTIRRTTGLFRRQPVMRYSSQNCSSGFG